MTNFRKEREKMVGDLKSRGITNQKVLGAFSEVPREYFVDDRYKDKAYADTPLPIGEGQTISQPYTTAFMTQLLDLKGDERVLEIGTGSGYSSAILAKLGKEVYSVEIIPILATKARQVLQRLAIHNVTIKLSDGSVGLREQAPFDAIAVTAGAPETPKPLIGQLAKGGRLVVPVGNNLTQSMLRIIKEEGGIKMENHGAFRFVPLVGEFGWKLHRKGKTSRPIIFKEK